MKRGCAETPPGSCHSAITKLLPKVPRMFPARGAAMMGELISSQLNLVTAHSSAIRAPQARVSGPSGVVFAAEFAQILRRLHRDAEVCAEQSVQIIEPQNLTSENAAEVSRE